MHLQQHLSCIYVDLFCTLLFEHRGKETCMWVVYIPHSKGPKVSSSIVPLLLLTVAVFVIVKWGMRGQ